MRFVLASRSSARTPAAARVGRDRLRSRRSDRVHPALRTRRRPGWGSLPQPLPASAAKRPTLHDRRRRDRRAVAMGVRLLLVALGALYLFFERTYYGKAIRAAANNPLGARLVGIDVRTTGAISVGLAIALAAYGGNDHRSDRRWRGAGGSRSRQGLVGAIVAASSRRSAASRRPARRRGGEAAARRVLVRRRRSDRVLIAAARLVAAAARTLRRARSDPRLIARLRADARLLPILGAIVVAFGAYAHLTGNATFAQAGTYAAIYADRRGRTLDPARQRQPDLRRARPASSGSGVRRRVLHHRAELAVLAGRRCWVSSSRRSWGSPWVPSRCAFAGRISRWQRSRSG